MFKKSCCSFILSHMALYSVHLEIISWLLGPNTVCVISHVTTCRSSVQLAPSPLLNHASDVENVFFAYRIRKSDVFAWDKNSYLFNVISPMGWIKKRKENVHVKSVWIAYIGCHVTLSLGWRHCDVTVTNDIKFKMYNANVIACGNECYFWNRKVCDPRDHCFASLGKASWCQQWRSGRNFLTAPQVMQDSDPSEGRMFSIRTEDSYIIIWRRVWECSKAMH